MTDEGLSGAGESVSDGSRGQKRPQGIHLTAQARRIPSRHPGLEPGPASFFAEVVNSDRQPCV